ncbi:Os02g0213800 [Oryza sativa Japonica Group]|uniref:Os02g0213800 protein n=1 Tax=Oryza sativa subsp. japonica TaxID=39947 RepID=Q6H8B7_ORYSJ|nr:hypothetical protein DAI22_02g087700 [Oryza sativa Japonica Group]BAD25032.1 hypothetical protein [Oryza sativa Japonica Group]BAH91586.1 Os02g0213800 [Oryza sativa Japonica Group]|eukprot:NP_001172857.1 Os02g0213800 [Oryza sativa Japonica Group]
MEATARLRVVAILLMSSLLLSPPFLLADGSSGGGSRGREMKHDDGHLVIAPRKLTWPRRVLNSGDQPNHDPIHNSPISPGRSKNEVRPGN